MDFLKLKIPRLEQSEIDAISAPEEGETVFNTTQQKIYVYNGTTWATAEGNGLTFADVWALNTLINC